MGTGSRRRWRSRKAGRCHDRVRTGIDAERIIGIHHPAAFDLEVRQAGTLGARREGMLRHHRAAKGQRANGGRQQFGEHDSAGTAPRRDDRAELNGDRRPSAPRRPARSPVSPKTATSIRAVRAERHVGLMASPSGPRHAAITAVWPSPANAPASGIRDATGPGKISVGHRSSRRCRARTSASNG